MYGCVCESILYQQIKISTVSFEGRHFILLLLLVLSLSAENSFRRNQTGRVQVNSTMRTTEYGAGLRVVYVFRM